MLQTIGNAHTRRACALIAALEAEEITVHEFEDALRHLPSEILQVTATVLGLMVCEQQTSPELSAARALCVQRAASSRSLC
jgi:hypothetical protein